MLNHYLKITIRTIQCQKLYSFITLNAWILAWVFIDQWLSNYGSHIDISLMIFVSGGLTGIALALITVIFQAIKSAIRNPVEVINYQ